ncbi:MAG: class I SAM-dependent methyltransferase [Armatimonadetes bacterium]|nr:class I SAM-dependent methyltransferase [Armatimonadota bacterium]
MMCSRAERLSPEGAPPVPRPRRNWLHRLLGDTPPTDAPAAAGSFEAIGPYYDALMATVPYGGWVDYLEALLKHFEHQPRTILDLACGTGKVGAELARRGYPRVFGVDLSEGMVRVAATTRRLRAAVQDARALGLHPASLDLVVSLYDSLNYVLEPEGLLACFRSVLTGLRPGGLFIFDLNTIRALALDLFTQDNLRSTAPLLYSWRSEWEAETRMCTVRMWFRWRRDGEELEFVEVHRQRGYADEEVRAMLLQAGFGQPVVFDAYSFDPLHDRSTRAFYIAKRPGDW